MNSDSSTLVVKVGGSLYDLPDLGARLRRWLETVETRSILLVPGGGALTNVVRDMDTRHLLGQETAHWLALRSLTVAAHFLAALLPGSEIIDHPRQRRRDGIAILDSYTFARSDEGRAGELPQCWDVTSDSIAARAAQVAGARRLVLLKSVTIPPEMDWDDAARRGWVDAYFSKAISNEINCEAINLRAH